MSGGTVTLFNCRRDTLGPDLGHPGQPDVASLGQDGSVEVARQVPAPGYTASRMLEVVAESGPAIDLDEEFAQVDPRKTFLDLSLQGHGAGRPILRLERRHDQLSLLDPDTRVTGHQRIDPV